MIRLPSSDGSPTPFSGVDNERSERYRKVMVVDEFFALEIQFCHLRIPIPCCTPQPTRTLVFARWVAPRTRVHAISTYCVATEVNLEASLVCSVHRLHNWAANSLRRFKKMCSGQVSVARRRALASVPEKSADHPTAGSVCPHLLKEGDAAPPNTLIDARITASETENGRFRLAEPHNAWLFEVPSLAMSLRCTSEIRISPIAGSMSRVTRGGFAPEAVERGAETMHRRRELPQWGLRLSVRAGACGGGPAMIPVPTRVRVWLGTRLTDMRPPGDERPVQART